MIKEEEDTFTHNRLKEESVNRANETLIKALVHLYVTSESIPFQSTNIEYIRESLKTADSARGLLEFFQDNPLTKEMLFKENKYDKEEK